MMPAGCTLSRPILSNLLPKAPAKALRQPPLSEKKKSSPREWPACWRLYRQPVLVEPYLSGREFTVGIVGTGKDARAIGSMEVILLDNAEQGVYSYVNKENCEELVEYRLVSGADEPLVAEAERISLEAWQVLGCRDGGRIDIRCDGDGRPQFMEVNPLAGIHPEHSDLPIICNKKAIPYQQLIREIVDSAAARIVQ